MYVKITAGQTHANFLRRGVSTVATLTAVLELSRYIFKMKYVNVVPITVSKVLLYI